MRVRCLKKYCDCFATGVRCSPKCNCSGCQNIVNDASNGESFEDGPAATNNFSVRLVYPDLNPQQLQHGSFLQPPASQSQQGHVEHVYGQRPL